MVIDSHNNNNIDNNNSNNNTICQDLINNNNINNNNCNIKNKNDCKQLINNIINNCSIQKLIVGFCWRDKYSPRKWKISLSLVSKRFHYFISNFCSENLDLTRCEETMTLDKDINIFRHFKSTPYTLFQYPPKRIQISTIDFKRLVSPLINEDSNIAYSQKIVLLFSLLESIELEYNGYSMSDRDLSILFSSIETIKKVTVQFNGKCCFNALAELNKFLKRLKLTSFSLLFLEEDGGRSEKMQICLPVISTTTTCSTALSNTKQLASSKSCFQIFSNKPVATTATPNNEIFSTTNSSSPCIRSYLSSDNVHDLESLHLESVSIFMFQELVCSMHHQRLNNLRSLAVIFDDYNLFSSISCEALCTGLLQLRNLEVLDLSLSIVFNNITNQKELFDISLFQEYLANETTLTSLSLDFISDDMSRVYSEEFIRFLFSEKKNLKKLRINTPLFSSIGAKSNLSTLALDYQANLKCCQLNEIDRFIQNLSNPNSHLKKLQLLNSDPFVNTFLARFLIHNHNGSIENLKVTINRKEFQHILYALSLNTTLKTLTLYTTNFSDFTKENIESLLLTLQDHPSIYKIVIETSCKTLCPYFLNNHFSIYYNSLKLRYYIFKK
ncbi:hypothetical protein DICPUDRAFT_28557 [Dictyostelium purpureum]|uniref:Uncharacterized protein n=1 Tax=Dictyostelium purpureum TaxID=5786 RepID=F0ZC31_DICPU|nr:uncharacterized protein DICPUDRAFT_28557 [Dictyostelium purpureum]EGC38503.1 hypothetical protein DICPUDRAFT_28557 [Dictyostelium purpureum]|eukprot:XP_003284968.1 hypothetical protein DICPUDRAFT_28557 [Dictyostelium purpureum]